MTGCRRLCQARQRRPGPRLGSGKPGPRSQLCQHMCQLRVCRALFPHIQSTQRAHLPLRKRAPCASAGRRRAHAIGHGRKARPRLHVRPQQQRPRRGYARGLVRSPARHRPGRAGGSLHVLPLHGFPLKGAGTAVISQTKVFETAERSGGHCPRAQFGHSARQALVSLDITGGQRFDNLLSTADRVVTCVSACGATPRRGRRAA